MRIGFPLPPGYCFNPSKEQLIKHYLIPKVEGRRLPSDHIYETTEIYGQTAIETTFQEGKQRYREYAHLDENFHDSLYFFTKLKKKWAKCSRISRTSGSGTWTGDHGTLIYSDKTYKVKKSILTLKDKEKQKIRTLATDGSVFTWHMKEYSIERNNEFVDCVIVKITKKKENKKNNLAVAVQEGPNDTEVDEAVPELPAAAHSNMQYALPVDGRHDYNYQATMGNGMRPMFPSLAEYNHLQYQPSETTDFNTTLPGFWGNCKVEELNAAVFQDSHQYPLLPGYQQETVVPPHLIHDLQEYNMNLSAYSVQAAYDVRREGDNAATQDHSPEGMSDPLVANSEVEAVQPQTKPGAISDEELILDYGFGESLNKINADVSPNFFENCSDFDKNFM